MEKSKKIEIWQFRLQVITIVVTILGFCFSYLQTRTAIRYQRQIEINSDLELTYTSICSEANQLLISASELKSYYPENRRSFENRVSKIALSGDSVLKFHCDDYIFSLADLEEVDSGSVLKNTALYNLKLKAGEICKLCSDRIRKLNRY